MFNPWRELREARQRASSAEERAAFLEQETAWMRGLVERSLAGQETALKIQANVASQMAFGFAPYPDVMNIPAREDARIAELHEQSADLGMRERERRFAEFKQAELKRFSNSVVAVDD